MRLFSALKEIQTRWQQTLADAGKRRDAASWKAIELLLGQPVITASAVAQRLGVSFPAAHTAIAELAGLDILRQVNPTQRRHRVFHAHDVMNALYTGLDDVLQEVERQTRVDDAR